VELSQRTLEAEQHLPVPRQELRASMNVMEKMLRVDLRRLVDETR
jgi:hypothetical protein